MGEAHTPAPSVQLQRASPFNLAEGVMHVGIFWITTDRSRHIIAIDVALAGRVELTLGLYGELVGKSGVGHESHCTVASGRRRLCRLDDV